MNEPLSVRGFLAILMDGLDVHLHGSGGKIIYIYIPNRIDPSPFYYAEVGFYLVVIENKPNTVVYRVNRIIAVVHQWGVGSTALFRRKMKDDLFLADRPCPRHFQVVITGDDLLYHG